MIPALDWNWQIYLLGWFSCLLTAMPIMVLFIIYSVDFSEENSKDSMKKTMAKLQKDNELLRTDNVFCRQMIDMLLEDKVNDILKGVK